MNKIIDFQDYYCDAGRLDFWLGPYDVGRRGLDDTHTREIIYPNPSHLHVQCYYQT
jgi:hypothetical protein